MKSLFSFLFVIASLCISNSLSAQSDTAAAKTVVSVVNLTCDGDMPTIKKQLLNQDGVESVAFTKRAGGASDFTILYNGQVISIEQIRKTIEDTPGCDDKSSRPYRVKKEKPAKTETQ